MRFPHLVAMAAALCAAFGVAACTKSDDQLAQGWVEGELVFVSPDEAGRVEELKVRQGDRVEAGALLFTVDPDLQQADVMMNEANLVNAQQAYDRAKELLRTAAGTQKTLEDAEAALRTAQSRLNSSKTRLQRRRAFAPAAGIIQQVYYRPGETVPAGRAVVSMLPPPNLKIRFFVPEQKLALIKDGDSITVRCDNCQGDMTAKVSFIAASAEFTPPVIYSLEERSKLVYLIEARPTHPENFRLGQPVDVVLPKGPGT